MIDFADVGIDVNASASGDVKAFCPKCHHERNDRRDKSLSVHVPKAIWHCHYCGWSSSLAKEARERGLGVFARPVFAGAGETAKPPATPRQPPAGLTDQAMKWFRRRRISEETIEAAGITASEQGGWLRIYIPYLVDGELVNVKQRIFPPNEHGYPDLTAKQFSQEKGALKSLYNIDNVPEHSDEIWICEGELDVLALRELRLDYPAVSLPEGAIRPGQNADGKLAAFDEPRAQSILARVKRIYLAVDSDESGAAIRDAIIERLGADRCFTINWPAGCKDANDVLMTLGAQELSRCLAHADPVPLPNVTYLHGLKERMHDIRAHGLPGGVSTAIPGIDPYYRILPGFVSVVSGIASHGKSQWLDNVILNIAYREGWKFAIFSPEKQPAEIHAVTLLNIVNGTDFWSDHIGVAEIEVGMDWLADHVILLTPKSPTIDTILETAKELVARHGIKGVVIDSWTMLETSRERQYSETEYIGKALREFKDFAIRHHVHIWIVVHPTKLNYRGKEQQPEPNEYDVSGSAKWLDLSDHMILVWRNVDDESEPVLIKVRKCRYRHLGKVGKVYLDFDKASGRYRSSDGVPVQGARHAVLPFDLTTSFSEQR